MSKFQNFLQPWWSTEIYNEKTGPMCMTARIYNFVEYIGVREYSGNTQGFFSPKIMWLHCASAKMHLNVGLTVSCTQCKKSRLFYAKYKLKSNELTSLKRIWNDIMYVCGTIMEDIPIDERNKDCRICERVYIRENLECKSNIEVPYYSTKIFKEVHAFLVELKIS